MSKIFKMPENVIIPKARVEKAGGRSNVSCV